MSEPSARSAVDAELKRLERRIDELVATIGQLKEENRALRQRQDTLMTERASLLQKNEQVRGARRGNDRPPEGHGARIVSEDRVTRVSVRLLDREYQVACPAEERSDLLDSAEYLDTKMREVRDWRQGRRARPHRGHLRAESRERVDQAAPQRFRSVDSDLGSKIRTLRERVESALEKGQQLEL